MKNNPVYQLKVMLQDSRPPVWRRLLLPANSTFWELHIAIQDSFGWSDYHLHQFFIGPAWDKNAVHLSIPHPDDWGGDQDRWADESKTKLAEFLSVKKPKLTYVYDFGDSWVHKVFLEKEVPFNPKQTYPQVITGKRACPWEDSGGVWGWQTKLEILKNKKHKEFKEIADWLGIEDINELDLNSFNPEDVVFRNPAAELRKLKKAWEI